MSKFRQVIPALLLLASSLTLTGSAARGDSFLDDGNQLVDQVRVAKTFGRPVEIKQVLASIAKFRKKYRARVIPPYSWKLDSDELQLNDLLHITATLNACQRTDAQSAERVLALLKSAEQVSTAPECTVAAGKKRSKASLEFNHRIATEALKNDLQTALLLRKRYSPASLDAKSKETEVNRICPQTDSFCSTEVRAWLKNQVDSFLGSGSYQNTKYENSEQIAKHLKQQFTELNYHFLLTSYERKFNNIFVQNRELSRLHQDYESKKNGSPSNDSLTSASDTYQRALQNYQKNEETFKAYQSISPSHEEAFDYTEHGSNFGLRNSCNGGSFLPALYSEYEKKYLELSGGPDGILLFTQAFKKHRMQSDGWLSQQKSCPDPYPLDLTAVQVQFGFDQAIDETAKTSALIRKNFADLTSASESGRAREIKAEWVRSFPKAVADAAAGHPENAKEVCAMVSGLAEMEGREHTRDRVIIGASVVAAGAMLVVPVFG